MQTVTAKEIAEALGINERSVQRRAIKEAWPFQKRSGRGGGNVYIVASLPESIHIALVQHTAQKRHSLISLPGGGRSNSIPSVQNFSLAPMPAEPVLPPAVLEKGALKADLVRTYLEAKEWGRKHGKSIAQTREAFIIGYNTGVICPGLCEQLGPISWKSLERWSLELRRADYDSSSIAPRYGLHRRGHTVVTQAESDHLLGLLLNQHQFKIGTAINLIKFEMARQGIASPSSPGTLRNFAEAWRRENADVWTLAREGQKALIDKIAPYLRRDSSVLAVGDVLIADGHRLNFRVKHPLHGRPCRASLICFEDWASRDIAGYSIMLEEDIAAVHLALYRAMLRLGKFPRCVLLDNGKAFKSKIFTSEIDLSTSGASGLYGRLGILTTFAQPYNARSKPIESFFKTMGLSFEKAASSYCGSSIGQKPARMHRNEKYMQALQPERVLTMEEASGLFVSWLNTFYRLNKHSGLSGRTPAEVFAAGQGPGLEHERVRYLMMHAEVATLGNNGITRFGGEYNSKELYGLRDRVLIRYDWHDLRAIWVYRLDGTFVCEAKRQGKVHPMFSLIGGKDAPGYSEFKQALHNKTALIKSTNRVVAEMSKLGRISDVRDILPLAEFSETNPRLLNDLEAIEAENTPPLQIPQFEEPDAPVPKTPMTLIDPTRLDHLTPEELESELQYLRGEER